MAGVPRPFSFIASASSFSSSVFPAVSIAVRSVASVKRFGGRVFRSTLATSTTFFRCPRARPGGSSASSPSSSFFRDAGSGSTAFQPASHDHRPARAEAVDDAAGAAGRVPTAVTTVVVAATCSSCQAARSRRTTRS